MSRLVHFVGSLPPAVNPDPRSGLEWIVEHSAGARLSTLPRDAEARWIADFVVNLAEREPFVLVKPGNFDTYDDQPVYRVKRGVPLEAAHLDLDRRQTLRDTLAVYRELVAGRPELAGVRHQVSLPAPLDLAMFTFGRKPMLFKGLRLYSEALAAEVTDLEATDSDVLVWQLETPNVLIMLNLMPRWLRSLAARRLARGMDTFLAKLPASAEVVLHLCWGNLEDTAFLKPSNLDGVDVFLNALRNRLLARGRALPPVHVPAAYGAEAPPTDPDFYTALGRVHPDWRFIAGVADENDPQTSRKALAVFESVSGRKAHAVATACGLARHDVADARRAAALMVELAG